MKINEMYEGDDLDFDMSMDSPPEKDVVPVKGTVMQVQLMRIQDSEPSDEVKNPVRTVKTDDGDELRVEWEEANAIMNILQSNLKGDTKEQIMKSIQTTKGLKAMLKFVHDRGMVK